jgi:hypothetical protein
VLVDSAVIYHGRSYGMAWTCPACEDVYVGCHKGTRKPLGRLANAELRRAKIAAHDAFDRLWRNQEHIVSRNDAYRWLTKAIGATSQVHIGELDVADCYRVVRLAQSVRPKDLLPT